MKAITTLVLVLVLFTASAQSWQWGKRGGGDQAIGDATSVESVREIKTDSEGNVYAICPVSKPNLDIDGHPKTGYSNGDTYDYALVSFACDGTYRWSKVIGGISFDYISDLRIDAQDNVYITGRVAPTSTGSPQVHFDDDLVLEQSASGVNLLKRGLFIAKYDKTGNMLWLKMPQPEDISTAGNGQCQSYGLSTSANGDSYWFTRLFPGIYGNGMYPVGGTANSYHILKYDAEGNFIGGIPISVIAVGNASNTIKMAINHATGTIYFAGYIYVLSGGAISFNGQSVTNDMYLVAYDTNGNFLWKKESNQLLDRGVGFTGIEINSIGDIYLSGGTANGMAFGTYTFTSSEASTFPFILKTNPNGEVIWGSSSAVTAGTHAYAITEGAAIGGFGGTLTWAGHTLTVAPNSGYDIFVTRFNPTTGEILAVETLEDDPGYADFGTAITKDIHGNFYVGGKFEHFLYVNSETPMINDGPQTDFFIAKFGDDNCALGVEENSKTGLNAYPNPVRNILNVPSQNGAAYQLYNVLGQNVQNGFIDANAQINIEAQQSGIYILQLGTDTDQQTIKIVKEK